MIVFRLFDALGKLGISLLAAFFVFAGLNSHFNYSKDTFRELSTLKENGVEIKVELDKDYEELELRLKGMSATLNWMMYYFEVDGEEYEGKYNIDEPDSVKIDSVLIMYLPSNPELNWPVVEIEPKYQEVADYLKYKTNLWLAFGALIVCILFAYLGIRKLKKIQREASKVEI